MAGFLQWYIRNLKTRPMMTNLGSGVVLMTVGDVMAQEIERHQEVPCHDLTEGPSVEGVPQSQRLHMRPYGRPLEEEEEQDLPLSLYNNGKWRETVDVVVSEIKSELNELDYFRTGTMIGWSVFYMTPVFLYFYRFLDRIFPQRTVGTIGARVLGSFLVSIPTNALFFIYGTSVHHTAEWLAVRNDWREELQDFGFDETAVDEIINNDPAPFDFEMLVAKSRLKIESELVNTISASAKAWIPINAFNFALVPSHLRPVVFMTASVFWNCYLSLLQHRDVALPPSMEVSVE